MLLCLLKFSDLDVVDVFEFELIETQKVIEVILLRLPATVTLKVSMWATRGYGTVLSVYCCLTKGIRASIYNLLSRLKPENDSLQHKGQKSTWCQWHLVNFWVCIGCLLQTKMYPWWKLVKVVSSWLPEYRSTFYLQFCNSFGLYLIAPVYIESTPFKTKLSKPSPVDLW